MNQVRTDDGRYSCERDGDTLKFCKRMGSSDNAWDCCCIVVDLNGKDAIVLNEPWRIKQKEFIQRHNDWKEALSSIGLPSGKYNDKLYPLWNALSWAQPPKYVNTAEGRSSYLLEIAMGRVNVSDIGPVRRKQLLQLIQKSHNRKDDHL